jgi:hypothetical protein
MQTEGDLYSSLSSLSSLSSSTNSLFDHPPVGSLPHVEADLPLAAVQKLLNEQGPPAINGCTIWARVIIALHRNGKPRLVMSIPLTKEATIPLAWQPSVVGGTL